ncbi:type II secretion system F family protein [Rhodopirellula sallentina]|uniref:Putative membrane protein n=1 Tax=Rhodopirellula sallentina SM41 TaxID=1263870 RepID=M5TY10_9BACT|nr:hypothetical protein [Rhodopirellula sallentina]EMI54075.1 putative membrane protein [Rhodopirellula sallentina SM41]
MTLHNTNVDGEIAQNAEAELWKGIRNQTRRSLSVSLTFAYFYLMAALMVGSYLITAVSEVGREAVYYIGWELTELDVTWMTRFAWSYAVLALLATITYVIAMLFIHNKLPTHLALAATKIPWIGSTMRAVSVGRLCESVLHSVKRSRTYDEALSIATNEVGDAALSRWSATSSDRVRAGHSMSGILESCPVGDQPLMAIAAFMEQERTGEEAIRVWHLATEECHSLAQSRVARATQFLSVSALLISVFLAAFAMLSSSAFISTILSGLM